MVETTSLKIKREAFRILRKAIGSIRPVESRVMFNLYEQEIIREIEDLPEKTLYNSFTETFDGGGEMHNFSARYNRSITFETKAKNCKTLTWNNISNHGLIPNTTDVSFVRLTINNKKIIKIEHANHRGPKGEFYDLQNPKYKEIGTDNLNRWYFLEFVHKELTEIKSKNNLN